MSPMSFNSGLQSPSRSDQQLQVPSALRVRSRFRKSKNFVP